MKSTGVVLILLLSVFIVCVYSKADARVSLMPNYPFVQRFENWKLEGSAYSLGDRIRLTGAEPNRAGIAKNIEMIDSKLYFEVGIEFSVHSSEVDGGEGFVLWITKDPVELGLNFGGQAIWDGLAIVFETNQHSQKNEQGLQFPRVSVHQNNGRKVFDWEADGSNTFLQGCHFPFKKINMDARNYAYLLVEKDTLHLFVSVKDQWQKCVIDQKITQIGEFYMTLTASTTSRSDFHDIFKMGVRLTDEFEHEQEAFARPPLSMLGPLITHNRDQLAERIMDVDDDDVIFEIGDFKNWIVSQLDSLKLSVGGSVVEINFGLDQLNQQSIQLYRELEKIRQSNANITSEFEKAAVQTEKILYSDKSPSYEPISSLHSDLKKVEAMAISISNSVTAIQQDQNRKKSMKNREKIQFEATLKNVASWGTIITVAIVAIVVVVYAFKQFKKPKHTSAPSWAA